MRLVDWPQGIATDTLVWTPMMATLPASGCGTQTLDLGQGSVELGQGSAPGTCATDQPTQSTFSSAAALSALLVGRWQGCPSFADAGPPPFAGADFAGVEFTSDGHVFTLALDAASGQLVRSTADLEWEYSLLDESQMSGQGTFQIDIDSFEGRD